MQRIRYSMCVLAATTLFAQQVTLRDTEGTVHDRAEWGHYRAIVVYFAMTDCPVSNGYVPELNRIHDAYAGRGALFLAVAVDPKLTPEAAAGYAREYGYRFPVLLDAHRTLARFTGATISSQVAVLSAVGRVLYLGRIDDRVEDFGVHRVHPRSTDLRDALDAVLAGRPVAHAVTKSIGCAIPSAH
jgi:peroxiredoxin